LKKNMPLDVLMVEGQRGDHVSFCEELNHQEYQITCARSGSAGLKMLENVKPAVVVVDAASLRTSGVRICSNFRKADNDLPIILIVEKDMVLPEVVDANLVLWLPFTAQKLANRLKAYRETDKKFVMKAGPVELNTQTQLVTCHDRQTKLTPRLVEILKVLMKNKGKVVERIPLFTQVWETEYTGDTRTLDVHISWLRQAIEEDPGDPQLIKTRRGVGYIFDV
jgi:DNA-binding response OmpR family regulator